VNDLETLVDGWLTVPDLAERLGTDAGEVRRMIEERRMLAVRRGEPRVVSVPEAFLVEAPGATPEVLPWLQGTVNVLDDAGFDDESAMAWLFRPGRLVPRRFADRGAAQRPQDRGASPGPGTRTLTSRRPFAG